MCLHAEYRVLLLLLLDCPLDFEVITRERDRNTSIQHYKTKAAGAPEVTAAKFRFMSSEEERE